MKRPRLTLIVLPGLAALGAPLAIPDLLQPVTNDAVAGVRRDKKLTITSFLGMRAWTDQKDQRVNYARGAARSRNCEGIRYDQRSTEPSTRMASFDLTRSEGSVAPARLGSSSMDCCGLFAHRCDRNTIGGLTGGQLGTAQVTAYPLDRINTPRLP